MELRPTGSLQETIVAVAEYTSESAVTFLQLVEQKKEVQRRIQKAREDAFFHPNKMAMSVGIEDIETGDIILPEKSIQEVASATIGDWRRIIEDCYSYRESRKPEAPLPRLKSVSENVELPTVDTSSVKFNRDNVRLDNINDREALEIHFNQESPMVLFIDSDNTEYYQSMTNPPVSMDLDSLNGNTESFDTVIIRNNSEGLKYSMAANKPETVQREISTTEVIFKNEIEKSHYIPESEVFKPVESDPVLSDMNKLKMCSPLPNRETKTYLLETLEKGYVLSKESLKLFEYINNNVSNTMISYSYTAIPEYINQIARLTKSNIANIPQKGEIILSDDAIPEWIRELSRAFPEKNSLNENESRKLQEFLDIPNFVCLDSEWIDDSLSIEILLELFESQEIGQDKIVSYYLVPWKRIEPEQDAVRKAVKYGEELRNRLKSTDQKYDLNLYNSTVSYEQRKIYRRSNFDI